jgi:hypothetical protein
MGMMSFCLSIFMSHCPSLFLSICLLSYCSIIYIFQSIFQRFYCSMCPSISLKENILVTQPLSQISHYP